MYLDAAQIDTSNRIKKLKYYYDFLMLKYYDVLIFVLYI